MDHEEDSPAAAPLPIKGMKVTPYMWGHPLMSGACLSHLEYAAGQEWMRDQFKADTGMDLTRALGFGVSPLEKMVDKATGFDQSVVAAFADWVTTNYWGVDGEEPPEEEST